MRFIKILSLLLAAFMLLSAASFASGESSGEASGSSGEASGSSGEASGSSGEASGFSGGRYLTVNADGLSVGESDTWSVEGEAPSAADAITGIRFHGGSASDRFLSVSAPEHVDAAADGFTAVVGSEDELYPAPNFAELYTNEGLNPNSEGFELDYTWISQIDWDEASPTYGRYTPVTAAGQALVGRLLPGDAAYSVYVEGDSRDDETARSGPTQVSVSGGAAALIQNAFIYSEGSSGVAISNSGSSGVGSTLVVRDSLLAARAYVPAFAGTSENMPNDPLLVTGADRASLSGGESVTYYYDSVITVDGWASLSTDAAGGNGVDLVAVNTFASALLGGYGTYSDHDCRDFYYGSVLEGAEIGVIISGDGLISLFDGDDGLPGGAGYGVGGSGGIDPYAFSDTGADGVGGSVIAGGRTGVMIHIAGNYKNDPQNENPGGTFTAKDSAVITDRALLSDEDIEYSVNASWYGRELSPNIQKFIDYIAGDAILLKSVNATVTLDNADIDAYSGVLIHSVINNDTGTVVTPADADPRGNVVTLKNMDARGDILDEDYERPMAITLDNTALTGAIVSGTAESWTEYWLAAGYAEDYTIGMASNTFGAEAPLDAYVHTLVMNDDGTYEITEYSESKGAALTLTNGSVWTVAGESSLDELTVEAGSSILGTVTVDGAAVDVTAGGHWAGAIAVSPADGSAGPSGEAS